MLIGKYYYPKHSLSFLVDEVKKLYDEFGTEEITREHIATKLNNSAKSGGFGQKLADFKAYGLLDGRGKFHVTDIGVKATFGTEDERKIALNSATRNIDLWKLFYNKWGTNISSDTFWIDLAEIANIERSEAKKRANVIRDAYLADAKFILPDNFQEKTESHEKPKTPLQTYQPGDFQTIHFQIGNSEVTITDKNSLDIILSLLSNLHSNLERNEEKSKQSKLDQVTDDGQTS